MYKRQTRLKKKRKTPAEEKVNDKPSLTAEWASFAADMDDLAEFAEGPSVEDAEQPVLLCNACGEALNTHGDCLSCKTKAAKEKPSEKRRKKSGSNASKATRRTRKSVGRAVAKTKSPEKKKPAPSAEDEFWELVD